jgi:hypothetical protein
MPNTIELVPAQTQYRAEDWYLEQQGRRIGYLYKTADGWTVGVLTEAGGPDVGASTVTETKAAALEFAYDNAPTKIAAKRVTVTVDMTEDEAWNLAQFLKRVGFSDFRNCAQGQEEAYAMRDAADRVAVALREAGYSPR